MTVSRYQCPLCRDPHSSMECPTLKRSRCVKCGGTVDRTRRNPGFIVDVCLTCWFDGGER